MRVTVAGRRRMVKIIPDPINTSRRRVQYCGLCIVTRQISRLPSPDAQCAGGLGRKKRLHCILHGICMSAYRSHWRVDCGIDSPVGTGAACLKVLDEPRLPKPTDRRPWNLAEARLRQMHCAAVHRTRPRLLPKAGKVEVWRRRHYGRRSSGLFQLPQTSVIPKPVWERTLSRFHFHRSPSS